MSQNLPKRPAWDVLSLRHPNHFVIQVTDSFSRIGTKIWNEMPVSLRKLSKNAFKRKIKQTLFEILASEDCYIDLPEIVQKVKLSLFSS